MTLLESTASSFLFTSLHKLSVIQHEIQIRTYKEYILLGLLPHSLLRSKQNIKRKLLWACHRRKMCPARGLAGHCLVEGVEGEHGGFSDIGKSWDSGSSAMSGETDVKITQCPFLQQTFMQRIIRLSLVCWLQHRCTPVSHGRCVSSWGKGTLLGAGLREELQHWSWNCVREWGCLSKVHTPSWTGLHHHSLLPDPWHQSCCSCHGDG